MSDKDNSAEMLIEFLKQASKNGSVVQQLEELQLLVSSLKQEKEEIKLLESSVSEKLRAGNEAMHLANLTKAEIIVEQKKLQSAREEFAEEKFLAKKDREHADSTLREIENKIGACEAKLKRVEMEDARVMNVEANALLKLKRLDEAMKQMKKILEDAV